MLHFVLFLSVLFCILHLHCLSMFQIVLKTLLRCKFLFVCLLLLIFILFYFLALFSFKGLLYLQPAYRFASQVREMPKRCEA